jgi:hypothetical protein
MKFNTKDHRVESREEYGSIEVEVPSAESDYLYDRFLRNEPCEAGAFSDFGVEGRVLVTGRSVEDRGLKVIATYELRTLKS